MSPIHYKVFEPKSDSKLHPLNISVSRNNINPIGVKRAKMVVFMNYLVGVYCYMTVSSYNQRYKFASCFKFVLNHNKATEKCKISINISLEKVKWLFLFFFLKKKTILTNLLTRVMIRNEFNIFLSYFFQG